MAAEEPAKRSRMASSVHDVSAEKPPFGARFLTDDADVWSQNAWDHVPPPDDQQEAIAAALARQKNAPVPDSDKAKYNDKPARHWDNFYKMNASNFFRNRKWLHIEFPELKVAAEPDAGPMTVVEIGCGAGNAVLPLLSENQNPHLKLHAYDYSSHAVKLVQHNDLYISPPKGSIQAAVWDLTSSKLPPDLEPASVDVIVLIFVLSALHPNEWATAVSNIHKLLKPGGRLLFRDYGRYDLTQLRFKSGRLLDDNFYIRGDKTRVYFFDLDELALLFTGMPAPAASREHSAVKVIEEDGDNPNDESVPSAIPSAHQESSGAETSGGADTQTMLNYFPVSASQPTVPPSGAVRPILSQPLALEEGSHPLFSIEQLGVDRRLIVNRKRQLKMYRVWMQGKFRKV